MDTEQAVFEVLRGVGHVQKCSRGRCVEVKSGYQLPDWEGGDAQGRTRQSKIHTTATEARKNRQKFRKVEGVAFEGLREY